MKRVFNRLLRAALFMLVFMPVHVIAGYYVSVSAWLMPVWFACQTLIAAMLTLLPAYVGSYREYEVINYVGGAGLDPNPDRQTEHKRVREGHRFPLRLTVDLALLVVCVLLTALLPVKLFAGAHVTPKVIFIVVIVFSFALAMRDIAMAECIWVDVPGICVGAAFYLIAAIYLRIAGPVSGLMNAQVGVSALLFLFIGAVTLNRQSVAMSMAAHSGEARKPPKQVRRRNRIMSLSFALIVAITALVEPIREGILWLLARIGDALGMLSAWINSLFPNGEAPPPEVPTQMAQPQITEVVEVATETYETSVASDLFVYGFFAIVGLALLWIIFDGIRKLCKKLKLWAESFALGVGEGFYDEREKLIAEDKGAREAKLGLMDRLRARLKREPGWESLDGRARMRRLLRELYNKRGRDIKNLRAMTAREAIDNIDMGAANKTKFGDAYDRARYSEQAVECAEADKHKRDARV